MDEYLAAVDAATAEGGSLRTASSEEFATMVERTSGDQLKALDASPVRDRVLESIFGRMGEVALTVRGQPRLTGSPVERVHRDAKIDHIFEGTEPIQQLVIARAISGVQIR